MTVKASDGNPAHDDTAAITVNLNNLSEPVPTITVAPITSDNTINSTEIAGDILVTGSTSDTQPGDTVTLTVNGTHYTGTVALDGGYSINVPGSSLAGSDSLLVSVTTHDASGNPVEGSANHAYSVDTTAPAVAIATIAGDDLSAWTAVTPSPPRPWKPTAARCPPTA